MPFSAGVGFLIGGFIGALLAQAFMSHSAKFMRLRTSLNNVRDIYLDLENLSNSERQTLERFLIK